MTQLSVSRLWLGCDFPLEVQNKCSEGTRLKSQEEEEVHKVVSILRKD